MSKPYEQYTRLRRKEEVAFTAAALKQSGLKVLSTPDPTVAPFEFWVRTPAGEELRLVCYLFRANKYRQGGRPADEHRFQIKYGSEFDRYHHIYIAEESNSVTLFFGVHLEEGIFIAVDPTMYQVTWFSDSVEFKTRDASEARRTGWHGWEKARSSARRKIEKPLADYRTQVLLGFTPDNFYRYLQFERAGTGLDPGERLLLIDRMAPAESIRIADSAHPLLQELGLSEDQVFDMIDGAFRLKVAVRGIAAEQHLSNELKTLPSVRSVESIDKDGQPDFRVFLEGRGRPVSVECKNVLRRQPRGETRVDFQKTRASPDDRCSRYYRSTDFDVLAACLHPVCGIWEFRYCLTKSLQPHPDCDGRLWRVVVVGGKGWTKSLDELPVDVH